MFKGFTADYLSGVNDPDATTPAETEAGRAEHRTFLESVGDYATKVIDPAISLVRAGTTAAREAFPDSQTAREFDEEAAGWQKHLRENLSPYQKAVDTSSYIPGYGERSAWDRPLSKITSTLAGVGLPLAAGPVAGAMGAGAGAVGAGMAGTFAVSGWGDAMAKSRDFAMDTPLKELRQSPVFQKAWIEFNGDEDAARNQFYNETKDVTAAVINGLAQGLTGEAIGRLIPPAKQEVAGLVQRLLAGRLANRAAAAGQGVVEGAGLGALTSGTATYAEQKQKVNAGLQANVDPHTMTTRTGEGAVDMGLSLGLLHGARGRAPPKPGEQYGPPNLHGPWQPLESDLTPVLAGQLASDTQVPPEAPSAAAPPPPPGAPPGAPPEAMATGLPPGPEPSTAPPPGPTPGPPPGPPPGPAAPPPAAAPAPPAAPPPGPTAPPPQTVAEQLRARQAAKAATPVSPNPDPAAAGPAVPPRAAGPPPPGRTPPVQPTAPEHIIPPQEGAPHGGVTPEGALAGMTPEDAAEFKLLMDMGTHKGNASSRDERRMQEILAKYGLGMPQEMPAPPQGGGGEAVTPEVKPAAEPSRPARIAKDAKPVGKNADGVDVWERPDGVRQYIRPSDGFVVTETVMGDRPGGAKLGDATHARPEAFKTAAAEARGETIVAPGREQGPAPATMREAHAPVALGDTLSPDEQAHMAAIRQAAEAAQSNRDRQSSQAERDRQAGGVAATGPHTRLAGYQAADPTRIGVRTPRHIGMERALEASINAFKGSTEKTVDAWMKLRSRAMQVETARRDAGLQTGDYLRQVGPPPATEGGALVRPVGVEREIPRSEERGPTPGEKELARKIEALHQQGDPDVFRAHRENLLKDARRLDAQRHVEGLRAMFEHAVPRESSVARPLSPERQFNEQVSRIELNRHLPTKQFVNSHVVRSALERMQQIEEGRRVQAVQRGDEYSPLEVPTWVSEKFAGHVPHAGEERMLVPNQLYVEASQRATARRHGQVLARAKTISRVETMKRRAESESTIGTQKHDIGTISGQTEDYSPVSTAEFARRQEKLREAKAPGTPVGDYLRRQAEEGQRELTKDELRARAQKTLEQERTAGKKRSFIGDLPTAEELNRIADAAFDEQGRLGGIAKATGSTRERHTAMRDNAIKEVIDGVLKKHFGEPATELREPVADLVDRLQIGAPPVPPDIPEKSQSQLRREKKVVARAGKPEMPKELVSRPRRGSPLTAAALNVDVVKALIKNVPGLDVEERKRTGAGESHAQIRKDYEKAIENWQGRVLNQIVAGYEIKPVIDEMIKVGHQYTEIIRKANNITGQSIKTWMPNGTRQRTADGHDFKKFTAGHAEAKAEHFNMMADLMNASEQLRIAQIYAPEVKDFDSLKPEDARHIITRLVPQLTKLGGDIRSYERGMIAHLNAARKAATADITEQIKGVRKGSKSDDATEEGGEVLPSRGEQIEQAPSPLEQMVAREEAAEPPEPTLPETDYQRRARERAEKRADENLTSAQRPSTQVKGERVLGKRGEGAFSKVAATEDQPPITRELSPADKAARIAELEKKYGTTITTNRRNRPTDGPPPETAAEHLHEVQTAREALATDDPQHPLISDHEPASTSIGRAKDILERGEAGDVSHFITPEFLDKLSKVNDGVQVLHAPVEVVAGKGNEGQAFYQPDKDRIVLSNNVSSGDYVKNVVHEHVHAATENLLHTDPVFRDEVESLRQTAERAATRAGVTNERLLYGLRDPHEFLSESQSNPEFRALLARSAAPGKTVIHGIKSVLNALYHTIRDGWRRLVGEKDADTALDVLFRDTSSVLGTTDKLVSKTLDRLAMEGRPSGLSPEGRRYRPTGKQVLEGAARKAGDLWSSVVHNKFDLGMSLQTTMDVTRRGGQKFNELARKVAEVASKATTMRGEIITKQDQPKLLGVSQWLNKLDPPTRRSVEKFLHDESIHGAFADVHLNDPKNKHISLQDPYNKAGPKRENLRDRQVHRNHADMMERYNELNQIPGFYEARKELHDFFSNRENEIREGVSRSLIEHLNVLPESAGTPAEKEAVINLLQKHLFEGKLSTAEKTQLEAIKDEAGRKVFKDLINRIRRTPELNKIAGPYIPLTRRGSWATFGRFKIPEGGENGEMPVPERDSHGRPVDEGTRMFDTREEAEAFEQRMHDKYGISQLDGGEWFIDKSTGKRAREYTEEELHGMQKEDPDVRSRLLKAGELPGRTIDFEGGQYEHKYWVKMQPKLLEFHNSKSEANRSAEAWRAKHGDDILVTNAEPVHRGSGKENEKYASAQMQKLIDRVEQTESFRLLNNDQKVAMISALTLQSAKLSLRRGIRQQFKAREYVAGVDPEHLMANAADYSGQTAGYLANVRHHTELQAAKGELDKFMSSDEQRYQKEHISTLQRRAYDELYRKINDPAESPVATPFARGVDFILKVSMFKQLAGVSYYVINGTEPVNLGAPMMMDRHGVGTGRSVLMEMNRSYRMINPFRMAWYGVKDAGKALMGKAEKFDADGNPTVYTDYAKLFKDAIAKQPDREGLEGFLQHAGKLGLFESSANVEYQRLLKGPSVTGSKVDKVLDYGTNVFQGANTAVENLNRFVTGITAYRLEKKRTGDQQAAVDYATDIMYRTNGDYRDWNTPSLFGKNAATKLAFQYHKYPQRVYVGYVEGAMASLGIVQKLARGEKPAEEDVQKARRLMGLMAMQVGFAGVLGLPTEILKAPLNAAYLVGMSDMTGNDAENDFRKWVEGPEGSMVGQVLADGFGRLTPVDFGGKMQINFGPYGSPESRKRNDVLASAARVFLGSGGAMAEQTREGFVLMAKGLKQIREGATTEGQTNLIKGGRLLAPVRAFADGISAIQGGEPVTTASGKTITPKQTPLERVIRATGFQPNTQTLMRESKERVKSKSQAYTEERTQLINDWVGAKPSERADIQKSINDFNRRYPSTDQRIQSSALLKGVAAHVKAQQTPAKEMGLPLSKRTRAFLADEPNYGAAR